MTRDVVEAAREVLAIGAAWRRAVEGRSARPRMGVERVLSSELFGFSRTFDDPDPPAGAEVLRFAGISRCVRVGNGPPSSRMRESRYLSPFLRSYLSPCMQLHGPPVGPLCGARGAFRLVFGPGPHRLIMAAMLCILWLCCLCRS